MGAGLGFQQVIITDTVCAHRTLRFAGVAGQTIPRRDGMDGAPRYDARRPHELLPGTLRVIGVRMNLSAANAAFAGTLKDHTAGYVNRYALGRDYPGYYAAALKTGRNESAVLRFAEF